MGYRLSLVIPDNNLKLPQTNQMLVQDSGRYHSELRGKWIFNPSDQSGACRDTLALHCMHSVTCWKLIVGLNVKVLICPG